MASAQMHVGVQGIGTSKMELQFLTRHGVTHMDAQVDGNDAETLTRHRQEAADEGDSVEMIHDDPARSISLAREPQRDSDIEGYCKGIVAVWQAGLLGIKSDVCVRFHQRTP